VRKFYIILSFLLTIAAVDLGSRQAFAASRHSDDSDSSTPKPRARHHKKPATNSEDADTSAVTPKPSTPAPAKSKAGAKAADQDTGAESTPVKSTSGKAGTKKAKTTPEPDDAEQPAKPSASGKKSEVSDAESKTSEETTPKSKTGTKGSVKKQPVDNSYSEPALPVKDGSTQTKPKSKAALAEDEKEHAEATKESDPATASTSPSTATTGKQYYPPAIIETKEITGYDSLPDKVKTLIQAALDLTKQNLTYTYGSADPSNGGMDCSGAIYYLLRQQGFEDVPRDSSGQYVWARKQGQFYAVISKKAGGFEFSDLVPGDLLFWNGTYTVNRDPPVTHVMIYLGMQRGRKQALMWGSSDGRSYEGKQRWGVSVFDFSMPKNDPEKPGPKAVFLGYAHIPGLR